jgi:NAD(P)-dependent dehydrogenase (short-subunit alcohol dehydrogenase family)
MGKRVFITGSADGLGAMAANLLVQDGHAVMLHARSEDRAAAAMRAVPGAQDVLVADVTTLDGSFRLAELANRTGRFDAVIHNVAVGFREPFRRTADGLPHVIAINSLAPYVLTAAMHRPARLVYLSSGLHTMGQPGLDDLMWERRPWDALQAYSDSKLHDAMLAFAVARLWPGTLSNALEPGWVATKMGGAQAPDDLSAAPVTQVWLAVSDDAAATVSGKYFYHQRQKAPSALALDGALQDSMLDRFASITGVKLTAHAQSTQVNPDGPNAFGQT